MWNRRVLSSEFLVPDIKKFYFYILFCPSKYDNDEITFTYLKYVHFIYG
jgi:hypothetical protein